MDFNEDGIDDISFGTHDGLLPQFYINDGDSLIPWSHSGTQYETGGSRSLTWVDYDNDGDKDLCVSNSPILPNVNFSGTQKLYRRDSDSVLTDVTIPAGWSLDQFASYASAWADYDNDGWLDCHLSCTTFFYGSPNILYRNLGDGTFEDVTVAAGVWDPLGRTLASAFFDADLDGDVDLFISNDRHITQNKFYLNNGDGTFTDYSEEAGLDIYIDGMGVAVGDYDNDGDFDLYLANTGAEPGYGDYGGSFLYENHGDGTWSNVAEALGVEVFKWTWGVHFSDVENDGDQDIVTVSWEPNGPYTGHDIFINESGEYTRLEDSVFEENYGNSYGSALGDFNDDGLPDLAVANMIVGTNELWRNDSQGDNNWVKIHLEGTMSNRDGIGAYVQVWSEGQRQVKFTSCGNGFSSQDSDVLIFGLGSSESVDSVSISWPSGFMNTAYELLPNARYDFIEDISNTILTCGPDFICTSTPDVCPEDFDQDGNVGVSDFVAFNSNFGLECSGCAFDLDGNGIVDIGDFLLLNSAYGGSCPP